MKISIKNFFLFFFLLLECVSVMAFATDSKTNVPAVDIVKPNFKVKVTVSWTFARRRDCEGFGICDLSVSASVGRINSCTGTISVDDINKNIMVLEINKSTGLSSETYNKYLSTGTFLMEDDSPISSDILRQLGLIGTRTLVAGKYPVVERNGIIYISIPVK